MKRIALLVSAFSALCLIVLTLSGCSGRTNMSGDNLYQPFDESVYVPSGVVSSNGNYQLIWDNDAKCILLYDVESGKVWSSTPYDFYMQADTSGVAKVQMGSPLFLIYCDSNTLQTKTVNCYSECISEGTVSSKKQKDGIVVTYYFERQEISIPVYYILDNSGLEVRLLVDQIKESDNQVCIVSILPFMVAASSKSDGYIVVPSGSGGLIYLDDTNRNPRTFYGDIYGEDLCRNENEIITYKEPIRMPFFGIKDGNNALCAVVEKGAECAAIEAQVGDPEILYGSAYVTFKLRGEDYIKTQNMHKQISVVKRYSRNMVKIDYMSVKYYPMRGEQANYFGMAELYRGLLLQDRSSSKDEPTLYLSILGGLNITKHFLGIPYQSLEAVTTFDAAAAMIERIKNETEAEMAVQLIGFGENGMDIGVIGGGFSYGKVFGGKKGYKYLNSICQQKNIHLYTDYDILIFNRKGSGVTAGNSAQSANQLTFSGQKYSLFNYNKYGEKFHLLERSRLSDVADRLLKHADESGTSGISLGTLSQYAYSDYKSQTRYCKNLFGQDAVEVALKIRNRGHEILAHSANSYIAAIADAVIQAPLYADSSDAIDVEVPLYQVVFKGSVPLSGTSINFVSNRKEAFLKCIETGSALCYTLCGTWKPAYVNSDHNAVAFSQYDQVFPLMRDDYNKAKDLLESVRGSRISSHQVFDNGLHMTEFENGVKVAVNYSNQAVISSLGKVEAQSFLFVHGGTK